MKGLLVKRILMVLAGGALCLLLFSPGTFPAGERDAVAQVSAGGAAGGGIPSDFLRDITQRRKTVGDYVEYWICDVLGRPEVIRHPGWNAFRQALNMSDWMGAAGLVESVIPAELWSEDRLGWLFRQLQDSRAAMDFFLIDPDSGETPLMDRLKPEFRDSFDRILVGWDNGRAFRVEIPSFPDHLNAEFRERIIRWQERLSASRAVYNSLEILNHLYQAPAQTAGGALVWAGQGHNWAYFAWKKAEALGVLPRADMMSPDAKKQRTVLVHWDAHKDLSALGGINEREELQRWLARMQSGDLDLPAVAEATSVMGVSRFIVPALYEGLVDEIVYVFPVWAKDTYWPAAGEIQTSLTIGITEDGDVIGFWSDDPVMQNCSSGFCRKEEWLRRHPRNQRTIPVRFTSPEQIARDPRRYLRVQDAVILNVDADLLGTYNPKHIPGLPDYFLTDGPFEAVVGHLHDFYHAVSGQVKVVSLAYSPNFSRDIQKRPLIPRILGALQPLSDAPDWVEQELAVGEGDE